jgi:hypothetical protein
MSRRRGRSAPASRPTSPASSVAGASTSATGTRCWPARCHRCRCGCRAHPGFTDSGVMTIDFFGFTDVAESVAVTDDGSILVSGLARDNVDGYGVARLSPQS